MLDFIGRQAAAEIPFFVTYWPQMLSFFPAPRKETPQWGLIAEGLRRLDEFIGTLMDRLHDLGITDNTLLVCHADNGPMVHDLPAGIGLAETIFRGGKGDFTEGGDRVPAFAWWPSVIDGGQIVNDMIHQVDLFTTFAASGRHSNTSPTTGSSTASTRSHCSPTATRTDGATTSTSTQVRPSRRPPRDGRDVIGWGRTGHRRASGVLRPDPRPRESVPMLIPALHMYSQFDRIRARHELWTEKYPHQKKARGVPLTGLTNARPETVAIVDRRAALRAAVRSVRVHGVGSARRVRPDQYRRLSRADSGRMLRRMCATSSRVQSAVEVPGDRPSGTNAGWRTGVAISLHAHEI
jgi:hypothetical protein